MDRSDLYNVCPACNGTGKSEEWEPNEINGILNLRAYCHIKCEHCEGKGIIPTEFGNEILKMVGKYFAPEHHYHNSMICG